MRALLKQEPASVTHIAALAGITQPAATQAITLMVREGLLCVETNLKDSRQRTIWLTPFGRELVPRLEAVWTATNIAADDLDADLPYPLSRLLDLAIEPLTREPFSARINRSRPAGGGGRARVKKRN